MSHQGSEGQEMQAVQGFRQALIAAGETGKTRRPAKGAFDHPTAGQKHEAFLGVGQLDHHQADALFSGGLRRVVTRIALIHKGDIDGLTGDCLNVLR